MPFKRLTNLLAPLVLVFVTGALSLPVVQAGPQAPEGSESALFYPLIFNNYADGPGDVTGVVVDSQTGFTLRNVDVCLGDFSLCTVTDTSGNYLLSGVQSGFRPFTATSADYAPLTQYRLVRAGETIILNFALSTALEEGQYRIVVTWAADPEDLDAHLWTPDASLPHVSVAQKGSCPPNPATTACLDHDDQNGFGPETITIFESLINPDPNNNMFSYGVLNFNRPFGAPPMTVSQARVQLYNSSGLAATFDVPTTGDPDLDMWYVFDLNGPTGGVTVRNCLTTENPADPDQAPICP